MADTSSGLESIPRALGEALAPLRLAVTDAFFMEALLHDLGWTLEDFTDEHFGALKQAFPLADLETIAAALQKLAAGGDTGTAINDLTTSVPKVFTALEKLSAPGTVVQLLPTELAEPQFWTDLALELPEYLLIRYLYVHQPVVYSVLLICGVIVEVPRTGRRAAQTRKDLRWDKLAALVGNPGKTIQEEYGWGGELRYVALQQRLLTIGLLLGAPARYRTIPPAMADGLFKAGHSARVTARALELPVHEGYIGTSGGWFEAAAVLAPMAENTVSAQAKITRLYLGAHLWGSPSAPVALGDEWTLTSAGSGDVGVAVGPSGVTFAGEASAIDAKVELTGTPKSPWILIGSEKGARLQLAGARASLHLTGTIAAPEVILEIGTAGDGLRLVLDFSEGDGFLSALLSGVNFDAAMNLGVSWSSIDGFTFEGSGTLAIDIPLNLHLGPISLTRARIELVPGGDVNITIGITGSLVLGPIDASVDNVGLSILAQAGSNGSPAADSFGGLKLGLAFKPPDGVGLAVDAGPVAGGGYLFFDHAKGQYAGALELDFETLALTAVGLLSTRLPDGSKGWALVAIISAEFPPINLGFGFTLNGVGGLLGVNRSVNTTALQKGIKTHTLDSILFPKDVVANAPKILADLGAVFPATTGQYIFGPMVKIGWGSPTIITADLGIVVELPDPVRVVLLGQIEALLPEAGNPLIELHIDVLGILDFESGELSIDASLYDSRLALYALKGDMALRADFIGDPTFALAVGGLNPRFPLPKGFPQLERLSISLDTGGNPKMVLEGYFGITSNSVQFGARFWIYAEALGCSLEGETGFNVLVILAPFQFAADMTFAITVRGFGTTLAAVRLYLLVTGPQPWRARGTAAFEIAGFSKDFDVDVTLPPRGTPALPEPARVDALVFAALSDPRNWAGRLDGRVAPGVALRDNAGTQFLVHPAGSVEARQKVAPLAIEIDCFGARRISGPSRYDITTAMVNGVTSTAWTYATDYFAPAQFYTMPDDQKLAGPSFETMNAGIAIGDGAVLAGTAVTTPLVFETVLIDPTLLKKERRKLAAFSPRHLDVLTLARRGPSARGASARSRGGRYRLEPQRVSVADLTFSVTSVTTGKAAAQVTAQPTTRAAAAKAFRTRVNANPGERLAWQIVPTLEVVG